MKKYKNKKIMYNSIEFDSKKECQRYVLLKKMEEAGAITGLQRQVKFELIPPQFETFPRYGKKGQRLKDGARCIEKGCVYVADFVYYQNGEMVVEDVKGYKKGSAYTVFTIKRKLMLYIHGIKINEV